MDDTVAVEIHEDGWAELILNRPERKNAITGPLGEGLTDRLADLDARDDVRVILLRGAGGAFCSGLDLKEFNAEPPPTWLTNFQHIWRGAHRGLFQCSKPIVGALERYAINGGAALALACDYLVMGEGAFLQVGEVQIGMAAPYNLAWLSLRHTEAKMAEIALLGDRLDGVRMLHLGIAQRSVPDGEVLAEATAVCERLATFPDVGLQRIKAGLRARLEVGADAWFDRFTGVDPVSNRPKPSRMKS